MQKIFFSLFAIFFIVSAAVAGNGLISVKSSHDVKVTADRLETVLNQKGMNVFIRIDHAAGAAKVDKELRPTELIIFGNPKVGTPLMQCSQSAAIDLPQKALIWQDNKGSVWLSYNDPEYLNGRHGLKECSEVIKKVKFRRGGYRALNKPLRIGQDNFVNRDKCPALLVAKEMCCEFWIYIIFGFRRTRPGRSLGNGCHVAPVCRWP